jgi:hypothetical protein
MATLEQIGLALRKAHEAGDVEGATKLAQAYKSMKDSGTLQPQTAQPKTQYEGRNIEDMSAASQFLTGVGNAALDIPRSFAQIYELGDQDKLAQNIRESRATREALSKSTSGSVGNIFGSIAPVMMTGGSSLPAVLATSAASGALQPTMGNESRLQNIGASTVSGLAGLGVAKAIPKAINFGAETIGSIGTHTGGESIRQLAKAGYAGGAKAESALANMRPGGTGTLQAIVDDMKGAIHNMRTDRGSAYREAMDSINADRTVLSFSPIRQAVDDVLSVGISSGGHVMNKSAAGVQKEINRAVTAWEKGAPDIDHTIQGLDELKQAIGNIRDSTEFGTPSRVVADRVYNAVRSQIINQAPQYKQAMKGYEAATNQIKEIEKSLSLGEKPSADTAIRKLLSVTRNNANTNFGNRLNLVNILAENGAPNALSDLSGQILNTWAPRGLGGIIASGTAGYGLGTMNPSILPLLVIQSPRLMGEGAYYAGKLAKKGNKLTSALSRQSGNIGAGIQRINNQ